MPENAPKRRLAAAAAVATLALALPAGASARSILLPTLTVPIPSPGHATAEVLSVKVTGRDATKNGDRFDAGTPGSGSLPSSVRVFSARRAIRTKSSLTYAIYVLAVNKGSAGGARAASAAPAAASLVSFRRYPATGDLHAIVLGFTNPASGNAPAVANGRAVARRIYCDACKGTATAQAVVNVDAAQSTVTAPLTSELKDLFSKGGSTASVFKRVFVARYDNGHAFQAKTKGAKTALRGVADDLIGKKPESILATVKQALGTSIE